MKWLQPQDLRLKAGANADREEIDPLKTLKNPAHRGAIGGLVDLVGNSLRGLSELAAQHVFCQAIDQLAQDHNKTQSHHLFRLFDKHGGGEEQGIFEKAKSPFYSS